MAQGQFPHDDFGDRYAIERELGHGATATVYLARDLKFEDKLVAIKVLSEHFALPVPRERFLREIQTTARLNHPHIVTLMESGTTRGRLRRPFYVMRFIDGDLLRDVIARGPLPVDEALRITRQVAGALGHAHRRGVIHRDIKPGNIMLEDGHTWVTDFGIARAMAATDGQTVTSTGVTIGTPAYMSPEQAMGRGDLDARSDIYSLGCVLFEMLSGRMLFDGPDVQVILNKHLVEPPPSIDEFRPEVPERVTRLLDIALAKKPYERFSTAADFAEALSLEGGGLLTPTRTQPVPGRRSGIRWKPRTVAAAAAATFVVGVLAVAAWVLTWPALRPDRYLVVPGWQYGEGVSPSVSADRLLRDQINQWSGITVMAPLDSAAPRRPAAAARQVKAAWYITGSVSQVGDSTRIRAALYATRGDALVRERAVNVAPMFKGVDAAFARLADQLLFVDTVWSATGGRVGTHSVAARKSFDRGLSAVQHWDLGAADSAFWDAAYVDPNYSQAHLWLAQVRFWSDSGHATWRSSAQRAVAGETNLSWRDQILARGLNTLGQDMFPEARDAWHELTRRAKNDFAGWYSLAAGLSQDDIVVPDSTSPSGWKFRSSYHEALKAYQRAFELFPAIHKALSRDSYAAVRQLLKVSGDRVRRGRAPSPDTTRFAAHASWMGNTLAFVPYKRQREEVGTLEDTRLAVDRQRLLFQEIAEAWVSAAPKSPEALEALAISHELLSDPSALEDIHRALLASSDPAQRTRLAASEVWWRVKSAVPRDTAELRIARRLADSIIAADTARGPQVALDVAALALLTGRGQLAAALSRERAAEAQEGVPPQLHKIALPLLVFAALGGPANSIRELEQRTRSTIDNHNVSITQDEGVVPWLVRPARLVFPEHTFSSLEELARVDFLINAQAASLRGKTDTVRLAFDSIRIARRFVSPSDVAMEGIYAEARLLAAIGDTAAAIEWLDASLEAVGGTASEALGGIPNAGAFVRAMTLRAELAQLTGDTAAAALWANVVVILWSDADPFLQPTVTTMVKLRTRK